MKFNVTKDEIQQQFHLPLEEAAKALGICASVLKRSCRQYGIKRWPYRKIKSLNKRKSTLESATRSMYEQFKKMKEELDMVNQERKSILVTMGADCDEEGDEIDIDEKDLLNDGGDVECFSPVATTEESSSVVVIQQSVGSNNNHNNNDSNSSNTHYDQQHHQLPSPQQQQTSSSYPAYKQEHSSVVGPPHNHHNHYAYPSVSSSAHQQSEQHSATQHIFGSAPSNSFSSSRHPSAFPFNSQRADYTQSPHQAKTESCSIPSINDLFKSVDRPSPRFAPVGGPLAQDVHSPYAPSSNTRHTHTPSPPQQHSHHNYSPLFSILNSSSSEFWVTDSEGVCLWMSESLKQNTSCIFSEASNVGKVLHRELAFFTNKSRRIYSAVLRGQYKYVDVEILIPKTSSTQIMSVHIVRLDSKVHRGATGYIWFIKTRIDYERPLGQLIPKQFIDLDMQQRERYSPEYFQIQSPQEFTLHSANAFITAIAQ